MAVANDEFDGPVDTQAEGSIDRSIVLGYSLSKVAFIKIVFPDRASSVEYKLDGMGHQFSFGSIRIAALGPEASTKTKLRRMKTLVVKSPSVFAVDLVAAPQN